jgi:hypothetical protein
MVPAKRARAKMESRNLVLTVRLRVSRLLTG